MRELPKKLIPIISVFLIFTFAVSVHADFSDEAKGGTEVSITNAEPFVATSFLGVDSLYSLSQPDKYKSDELVVRFYRMAYGLNVSASSSGPVLNTEGYVLRRPVSPQQGDIVYAASEGHWAIVKSNTRGRITLFEQDVRNNGKASINRVIKYPSDSYTVYSPRAVRGNAYPTLKNVSTGTTVLIANGKFYDDSGSVNEITTETETEETESTDKKGEKTKDSKDSSTYKDNSKVDYTTYKSEESSASPAAPVFTTEKMPDGYEEFLTSTTKRRFFKKKETTTEESKTERLTETEYYIEKTVYSTAPARAEEKKPVDPALIFGVVVVAGIVCIAAAGILAGVAMKKHSDDDDD